MTRPLPAPATLAGGLDAAAGEAGGPQGPVRPAATAGPLGWIGDGVRWFRRPLSPAAQALGSALPKGLYARSLIIIVAPMVLLQSIVAYAFMERHWQSVTRRLSVAVSQDVAAVVDLHLARLTPAPVAGAAPAPAPGGFELLQRIAEARLNLDVDLLPPGPLPAPLARPFFSILDDALTEELGRRLDQPFWIDTVGRSNLVEIRIRLPDAVMRVVARRSQAYASNAHIFLVWMVASSLVLLVVAVLFLRNQIRPILRLADAAEAFGKGREIAFQPRGAREVRRAGFAFLEMKRRIERAVEQRTQMLNGVSHDLRTILTRFRLSLALLAPPPASAPAAGAPAPDPADLEALERDVDEMSRMLEDYLAFARGDSGEAAQPVELPRLFEEVRADAERRGRSIGVRVKGDETAVVRPDAFKRLVGNLVENAGRHGDRVEVGVTHADGWLTVNVDDDGPGIPPEKREDVFKPFVRLDDARNQDEGGTGLGLAIARDIARGHGGDIVLGVSPLGGLRARVRIPG